MYSSTINSKLLNLRGDPPRCATTILHAGTFVRIIFLHWLLYRFCASIERPLISSIYIRNVDVNISTGLVANLRCYRRASLLSHQCVPQHA